MCDAPVIYSHTDRDGDVLEVQEGQLSAVLTVIDSDNEDHTLSVAVRKEGLGTLISTLQRIHVGHVETPEPEAQPEGPRVLAEGGDFAIVSPVELRTKDGNVFMAGNLRQAHEPHAGLWAYPFGNRDRAERVLASYLETVTK